MNFANIMRDLRKEKQLNQKDLAKELNVSQSTICHWENEDQEPNIEALVHIAQFFRVSIDYLLGYSDDMGSVNIPYSEPILSADERELLEHYRNMSEGQKKLLSDTATAFVGILQKNKA